MGEGRGVVGRAKSHSVSVMFHVTQIEMCEADIARPCVPHFIRVRN